MSCYTCFSILPESEALSVRDFLIPLKPPQDMWKTTSICILWNQTMNHIIGDCGMNFGVWLEQMTREIVHRARWSFSEKESNHWSEIQSRQALIVVSGANHNLNNWFYWIYLPGHQNMLISKIIIVLHKLYCGEEWGGIPHDIKQMCVYRSNRDILKGFAALLYATCNSL